MRKMFAAAALMTGLALASQAAAAEVVVKLEDRGAQGMMVFEPASAKLKLGDTVRFVPATPGHNVETILGMLPPGATAIKGGMSQEMVVKFAKPGVYGFKCAPHFGFGMTFVAKVGDKAANLADAQAAATQGPPMAKKRLAAELATLN